MSNYDKDGNMVFVEPTEKEIGVNKKEAFDLAEYANEWDLWQAACEWQKQQTVDEIESLRQRVKELERENADHLAANKQMLEMMAEKRKELATLKEGQGEPVGYVRKSEIAWITGTGFAHVEITSKNGEGKIPLYTAPTIPESEPVAWVSYKQLRELKKNSAGEVPIYTSAPTIPEGWVMVPVKATYEMREAGRLATQHEGIETSTWLRKTIYDAMLAAAPKPEEKP